MLRTFSARSSPARAKETRLARLTPNRWHYRVDSEDAKGNLHPVRDEEYDAFFVNGHAIRLLVKRNGHVLSAADQEREEARARNDIEKVQDGAAWNTSAGWLSCNRRNLAGAIFSNPRRISLNGRDTLAVDFAPGAHANLQRSGEGMAGTIWVDEADREIARFECRHDDPSRRGSTLRGNSLKVEQSPVGEGIWMPVSMEQEVGSPEGLIEIVSAKSAGFRKFDVQSTSSRNETSGVRAVILL